MRWCKHSYLASHSLGVEKGNKKKMTQTVFRIILSAYLLLVVTSFFVPPLVTQGKALQSVCYKAPWNRITLFGILLVILLGCSGLLGLFLGFEVARWLFVGAVIMKIFGTWIFSKRGELKTIDAIRNELEFFLEGIIVATTFLSENTIF